MQRLRKHPWLVRHTNVFGTRYTPGVAFWWRGPEEVVHGSDVTRLVSLPAALEGVALWHRLGTIATRIHIPYNT